MDKNKSSKIWNLIVDEIPRPGSWNMAVDEYLFQTLSDKEPQTILRFYGWKKPTVSIGYSQPIDQTVNMSFCHERNIDIVRRMTGGKLVFHDDEVTYSVCSSDITSFTSTLDGSYRKISKALICGLKKMGLDPQLACSAPENYARNHLLCFSHPAQNEIEITGKKIVGSAQKRTGILFIQHGSIPLESHEEVLREVFFSHSQSMKINIISLSQALGKKVNFQWVVDMLILGFKESFKVVFQKRHFSSKETDKIRRIQTEKYACPSWTISKKDSLI
jgi:lipoate-protein ligase A